MNSIFFGGIFAALVVALLTKSGDGLVPVMMDASADAITLSITLAASYALWCGVINVFKKAGLIEALARGLRRPLRFLFPGVTEGSLAAQAIALNMSANMLGVGNAATPAGLEAVARMRELSPSGDAASDDIIMLLAINCSSIQLIPTTVIGLRAAAGAVQPADILLPTLLSTAFSTLVAVALVKLLTLRRASRRNLGAPTEVRGNRAWRSTSYR